MKTAVGIISHNYGRFLREAIDSVLAQQDIPVEIVVTDDSSGADTSRIAAEYGDRGVSYLRGNWRNVHCARRALVEHTSSPFICWLDADDRLPPNYFRAGIWKFRHPGIGVVYSDMQTFGNESSRCEFPGPDRIDLSIRNSCHAGSLVRRSALETSGVFDRIPQRQTHADWYTWRRIQQHGWKFAKSQAVYRYRKHGDSMLQQADPVPYRNLIVAEHEPLTLWIPLSGRKPLWPRMADWLKWQKWPRDVIRLVLCDTSQNDDFGAMVQNDLHRLNWPDARYFKMSVGRPGLADDDRYQVEVQQYVRPAVARIYRTMTQQVATDFVCVIEVDIVPPTDAIASLWDGMDEHVSSVSGAYRSRFHQGDFVATDMNGQSIPELLDGITQVSFNGFGCVLLRTQALKSIGIQHSVPTADYDLNFAAALATGNTIARVNWDCLCEHVENVTREVAHVG